MALSKLIVFKNFSEIRVVFILIINVDLHLLSIFYWLIIPKFGFKTSKLDNGNLL